ncbi:MAG: arginase family protein [Alphaproteobacteria bacterium]|nr:arginase family protein [Alphaproteobacteria bacterium]
MKPRWLVTPYFFEQRDLALTAAVSDGVKYVLNDRGDLPSREPAYLARLHKPIAEFTCQISAKGGLPISIAGDCMASLPVMAGLQGAGLEPILVWLDAHGDFNTAETSPSGFLGGMPLAMMVGRGNMSIAGAVGLTAVTEQDVWLVDGRDLDPLEAVALASSGINRCFMQDLAALRFDRPIHLHIDNDVVDAAEVPANNYPVAGGPSLAATIDACAVFAAHNNIRALSLSGWNGALDKDGKTATACRDLMQRIVAVC